MQEIADYTSYSLTWAQDDSSLMVKTRLEVDDMLKDASVSIQIPDYTKQTIHFMSDDTIHLSESVVFEYAPDKSYPPKSYYLTHLMLNDSDLLTTDRLVSNVIYSETSELIAYIAYCNPSDISDSFLQGEWSSEEQTQIETALFTIDIKTDEVNEIIACGEGSQMFPSFSPDGQSLLFIWINDNQWNVYQSNLADGMTSLTRIS